MDLSISGLYEKKINNKLDRIIGDKDEELRTITKLSLMKDDIDKNEILEIIKKIRETHEKEARELMEEMTMTLNEKGEIVNIN